MPIVALSIGLHFSRVIPKMVLLMNRGNEDLEEYRNVFDTMPAKNIVSLNLIAGYAENGRMDEARVLFEAMEDQHVVTWTSMIAGYCRAGDVEEVQYLFLGMPKRNVVSWTAMIGGFTWNGFHKEALLLFLEMQQKFDIRPSTVTFVSLAHACAGGSFPLLGKQLHTQLIVNSLEYDDYDSSCYGFCPWVLDDA
ncbi:putative Pentatricopeptide (PPR) repeat-containing protein [Tripterygium wilfordii]|uniref:Putative Pentatricopeptide (PPR) repeat-containing protein n=1 Tax=Tripterygium wilfordii TaxID=458696 RepID=A0A7J7DXL7_TRIWF|nr:putative Pentatricopeptide (PPR) repeat-containing protein [Tripterygium wilfordii]